MMTMAVPGAGAASRPALNKTVPMLVAALMALGLIGLIVIGVIAGKKHLEF
jgi:hypothetical protein